MNTLASTGESASLSRRELAQRLEAAHEWCILRYAESLALHRPAVGAEWLDIAGGHAFFTGPSPFSFAVGIAMKGPISAAEFGQIEQFFSLHKAHAAIDVSPYSDPTLLELLNAREYRPAELTSVLCLDLTHWQEPAVAAAPGIQVRWAEDHEVDLWVDMIARVLWSASDEPRARANMAAMFRVPNSLNALAFVEGKLAGVAGGMLPAPGGIAPFFASCTEPHFRGRGVHSALLNLRLTRARQHGCSMIIVTAIPGSDSERNLERHGFTVAYHKQTFVK